MRDILPKYDEVVLKKSFIFTFLIGLVAHGYCFFNLLLSHDSLKEFYLYSTWPKAKLGRIFYSIYIALSRGRIAVPWLIGILALCWTSLAVYLIIQIFDIENSVMVALIAGICITNPTTYALAATYIHDLDADLFSMLLAVCAAFLWFKTINSSKFRNKCIGVFFAAICLSISMGIYQSYISVTIALIMIFCIKRLVEGEEFKVVIYQGLIGVIIILLAGGLYYFELKMFSTLTGIPTVDADSYNGLGSISNVFSTGIFSNIGGTYYSFAKAFYNLIFTSYPEIIMFINQMVFAISITTAGIIMLKNMKWKSGIIFCLLILLLPFGMNITYALSGGMMHVLMQYAIWFIYILAVVVAKWLDKSLLEKILKVIILATVCFTITENIQISNTIYIKKELEYQTTFSYMTRIIDKMETCETYVPGETPVVFIFNRDLGNNKYGFDKYSVITGVSANSPITYYATIENYFEYILGIPINLKESEGDNIEFTDNNIVQMIDGIMYVNISE